MPSIPAKRFCLSLAALLPLLADLAPAAPVSTAAGHYTLSDAHNGARSCQAALTPDNAPGGHYLELEKTCAHLFGFPADSNAWAEDPATGTITFYDDLRHPVVSFERAGNGRYSMSIEGLAPDLLLQRRQPVPAQHPSARKTRRPTPPQP